MTKSDLESILLTLNAAQLDSIDVDCALLKLIIQGSYTQVLESDFAKLFFTSPGHLSADDISSAKGIFIKPIAME
jgi:hypothetical protein